MQRTTMQRRVGRASLWSAVPLALVAVAAIADNGVNVTIMNDGTEDILVTVYDITLGPRAVVLSHARINGFTTLPLQISADDSGRANLAWTAVSVDTTGRKCGHAERLGLGDAATVHVHADADCTAAPSLP